MSIALERSNSSDHRIERSGFVHKMSCAIPVYNSPEYASAAVDRPREEDRSGGSSASASASSSSPTSSIGKNSDESSLGGGGGGGDGEEEVQSVFKGSALDSLEALEEVLPIKRGISHFYSGKSKSFTSLADAAASSSIEDITKPENAYTRKRKNLLAYNNFFNKSHNNIPRSNSGGISKRPTNSRSSLALVAMGHCESNSNSESSNSNSSSPVFSLPPLPPQSRRSSNNESSSASHNHTFSPWRSFSLSDLQGAAAATPSITGFRNDGEVGKLH